MIKRMNDIIEKIFLTISAILLAVFVVVIFVKVIARNYLHFPMLWSDEASLLCFIWSIFLGSAVALRRRKHFVVQILPEKFVKTNQWLEIFSHLVMLALIYVMIFDGYKFTEMGLTRLSTTISMPLTYFFMPIPISGVAMFFFSIELIITDIRGAFARGKEGAVIESTRSIAD